MNMDERLERMARAADRAAADYSARAHSRLDRRDGSNARMHVTLATLFGDLATVLRAGIDPAHPVNQENLRD